LKGIYTILIDKFTSRDDFIFYFDRVATTLINKGLEFNNFENISITTPLDASFETVTASDTVIAVSIIRSGDCFMHSLRKTLPEIAIGKLLIQSDSKTGEPQLHTNALPKDISSDNKRIILLDAQIISGAAVIMAIQVLIDYGVDARNITLVCYLATEIGLSRVLKAFRDVKVVVGEIGYRQKLESETWFRKRFIDEKYFGT
jgi:uridine kinase